MGEGRGGEEYGSGQEMGLLKSPPFWQLFLLDIYIRFCLKEGFCGKKRRRKKEGLEERVGIGGGWGGGWDTSEGYEENNIDDFQNMLWLR